MMKPKNTYGVICLVLGVMFSMPAAAQHYVGVKGGYGEAMGRIQTIYGKSASGMIWGKYNAGMMWKYYSSQQVVGGVSAEIEYSQRGYRIFNGTVSDSTAYTAKTRTVNTVTVPLIWQPHVYMMNRHLRVFLNAGITFSYNLGIGDTYTITEYDYRNGNNLVESTTEPYHMQIARDNRWNYGICGGFGVGVLFGKWEVFAEARYNFGMSDIMRNSTKYRFNEERVLRSELDNLFVTVGVFFRLGKGGITELPLGRRNLPPPDENDFRNKKPSF